MKWGASVVKTLFALFQFAYTLIHLGVRILAYEDAVAELIGE